MVGPQRTERKSSGNVSSKNSPSPGRVQGARPKGWTSGEDDFLWSARAKNTSWDKIADQLADKFPPETDKEKKTANACRKRHERIRDKKLKHELGPNQERWDEVFQTYKEHRERMWRPLAASLGYKRWEDIEATIMRVGLPTILQPRRDSIDDDRSHVSPSPENDTMSISGQSIQMAQSGPTSPSLQEAQRKEYSSFITRHLSPPESSNTQQRQGSPVRVINHSSAPSSCGPAAIMEPHVLLPGPSTIFRNIQLPQLTRDGRIIERRD